MAHNIQVQWCGGKVMKETGTRMTHLVAANSMGEKYQWAQKLSSPIALLFRALLKLLYRDMVPEIVKFY